ncbi:hypothetical protein BJ973_000239 [Actinoplanes tereljensis]|uniref:Uncharacterized protein n=1 Tax=Paractinoplanes tereljensis TaxID=571912 RepID=A0A919TU90_9ACTN|nr:RNaseH domain-containing protein [Actinoplanes tereljensis]GIF23403.1 hypothetical protein Ate02nite_61330 [Actinoplanes tereljensis]
MHTLAFPYTDVMAGPVHAYDITAEVNDTWQDLTRRYTREPAQLPYRDLTDALRYVSKDYATIRKNTDGPGALLLMRKKIPITTVAKLFSTFERLLAQRYQASFDNLLGPMVSQTRSRTIKVTKYLQPGDEAKQQDIPAWVFDIATWSTIELLKGQMRLPDGTLLNLRPDTTGNLVAYDHPLPVDQPRAEQGIHYVSLTPITLPGYPGILLNLDAHISSTTGFPGNARSLWIAPDGHGPLLVAKHRYDRERNLNLIAGQLPALADSFTINGIPEHFTPADLQSPKPRLRARHATTPDRHPIASGPGRKFLDALLEHATQRLGTESLILQRTKIGNINSTAPTSTATSLSATISTAPAPLHLTVVYADDIQRARAQKALTDVLGLTPAALDTPTAAVIDGKLTIKFLSATNHVLLEPGPPRNRAELIDATTAQRPSAGTHMALVQTSKSRAATKSSAEDPKPQIRTAMAAKQIVTQFFDAASTGKPDATDYPANGAIRDLLRAAGITATTPTRVFERPLQPGPCVIVGVYTREQNRPAKRMISLAALVTDGSDQPWQMLGYHPDARGWSSLSNAITAHHATDLTRFDQADPGARASQARDYAERALQQLRTRFDDMPIVIYVDSSERFPLWRGLTNKNLSSRKAGDLPHLAMPGRDISLVRVNAPTDGKLPQPVRALTARANAGDGLVSASERLYQLAGATSDTFYLINRSRTDKALDRGVRLGHRKTRFEISEDNKTMRTPWHAMTCTEFVIVDRGAFTAVQLGAMSARLCGHPLAWDGRTSRPAPVHLAYQTIQGHPQRT